MRRSVGAAPFVGASFGSAALVLGLVVAPVVAWAATVQSINYESAAQSSQIKVILDAPPEFNVVDQIKEKGYCYVDLYGLTKNYKRSLLEPNDAALKNVDFATYPDFGVLRVVLYAQGPGVKVSVTKTGENGHGLLITAAADPNAPAAGDSKPGDAAAKGSHAVNLAPAAMPPSTPPTQMANPGAVVATPNVPAIPAPMSKPAKGGESRRKTIVIDPGHGGQDSGAVSRHAVNGVPLREKDLNLKFAYELKRRIDQWSGGNMVAIVTRTDDRYVGLYQRVKMAEEDFKGDFFISIHMNDGGGNPEAKGVEIYYLNNTAKASAEARAMEERENKEFEPDPAKNRNTIVGGILSDVQRNKLDNLKYESYLACRFIQNWLRVIPHFQQNDRGVKSANFVVLKNFTMPAVLLEVGFVTNGEDLRMLADQAFQQATAAVVYNGICQYLAEKDPQFVPRYVPLGKR